MDKIDKIVIYTDYSRYWLMEGVLDLAERLGIQSYLQIIEEITDEEGMEIRQSLHGLDDTTLLFAFFSTKNPVLEELQPIFPLLKQPVGYKGYSIIGHQDLQDQYFPIHMDMDVYTALEESELLSGQFHDSISLQEETLFLEAEVRSIAHFPFANRRHIIFPATELILELDASSLEASITDPKVIGQIVDREELVDPMGKVHESITILVEGGQITDVTFEGSIGRRFLKAISLPSQFDSVQLSIGLGPRSELSGFIQHDRLLSGNLTLSFFEEERELFFELVVGQLGL